MESSSPSIKPRPFLAIMLCLGLFLLWSMSQQRKVAERQRESDGETTTQVESSPPAEPPGGAPTAAEPTDPPGEAAGMERPERRETTHTLRTTAVEGEERTELVVAEVSARGLARVVLPAWAEKDYAPLDGTADGSPLILIPGEESRPQPLSLHVDSLVSVDGDSDGVELPRLDMENWELVAADEDSVRHLNSIDEAGRADSEGALEVVREIRADPGRYHLDVRYTFRNPGSSARTLTYELGGPLGMVSESVRSPGRDLLVGIGMQAEGPPHGEVAYVSDLEFPKGRTWYEGRRPCYAALMNNYFAAILAAVDEEDRPADWVGQVVAKPYIDEDVVRATAAKEFPETPFSALTGEQKQEVREAAYKTAQLTLVSSEFTLEPGESTTHRYLIYLGPRESEVLDRYEALNFSAVNDYGWTSWIVKLFLGILKSFHWVTGSWGVAIMCLTLVVRFCLHPINRKQQLGMSRYQKKMSKVQPLLKEIQKKYEKDRMKLHQEMQKLFKEHDIRHGQMMGGCLMIFLQLPIWIGLINTLDYSLDLRQQPFVWIDDLSQPDRTYDFVSQPLPLLPRYLNVLPIFYVILMLVNQKLQPKATDPQMQASQRMMSFMMIAFGFIFYSFPSGLMVYFIVSAVFGLCESRLIKRIIAREEKAAASSPASTPSSEGGKGAAQPAYTSKKFGKRRKPTRAERQKAKGLPRLG